MTILIITGNQKNAPHGTLVGSSILVNIAFPILLIITATGLVFVTLTGRLVIVMNQIIAPLSIVARVGHLLSAFLDQEMEPARPATVVIVSTEVLAMLLVMVVSVMIHSTIGRVIDVKQLILVGN